MLPLSTILEKINPLDKNNSLPEEYCLALVIGDKKVKSAIWNLSPEGKKNFSFGSFETWGNESAEELIVAADTSIANAVTRLPSLNGQQPTKVVLGLPEFWVAGNNIAESKREILQTVCKKLLLKPLGFVVAPEAVAYYLKKEEGGLPSVILVNLGETEIVVSLISQGKFLGSKVVGRSNSLALDLEEGLLRFSYAGVLPSRILLIEDAELGEIEELKRDLVAYSWIGPDGTKKLNFLQLPKVELAESNFEITAVVSAGTHELGLEKEKGSVLTEEVAIEKEPAAEVEKERQKGPILTVEEAPAEEEVAAPEVKAALVEEAWPEADFGFVKEEDVMLTQPPPTAEEVAEIKETVVEEEKLPEVAETPSFSPAAKPFIGWRILLALALRLKALLRFFKGLLRLPRLQFNFLPKKGLAFAVASIFLIFAGSFLAFWKMARAEVKIFVQPQKVEKEFEFTVAAKTDSVDSSKMTVPGRELSVDVSGEKTANVTGKKTIGDKAKGEVVIYNGDTKTVTFAKGVAINGPSGTKFAFDQEVKVASASVDWATTPPQAKLGESKVAVTAASIGAQYNVAGNSEFSPEKGTFTNLKIKNLAAFAGGTSREIQAVSKDDQESLEGVLLKELSEKAKTDINGKLSPQDSLLAETFKLKSKVASFNHEIDDEASSLTLQLKATYVVNFVKEDDFRILADQVVAPLIPSGYQRQPVRVEKDSSVKDKVKGVYTAQVKEEFMPEMAIESLPAQLKGKTFSQGKSLVESLSQPAGVEINVSPHFFSRLKIFPLREQNITVVVETL